MRNGYHSDTEYTTGMCVGANTYTMDWRAATWKKKESKSNIIVGLHSFRTSKTSFTIAWTYGKLSLSLKSGKRSPPITRSSSSCAFFLVLRIFDHGEKETWESDNGGVGAGWKSKKQVSVQIMADSGPNPTKVHRPRCLLDEPFLIDTCLGIRMGTEFLQTPSDEARLYTSLNLAGGAFFKLQEWSSEHLP